MSKFSKSYLIALLIAFAIGIIFGFMDERVAAENSELLTYCEMRAIHKESNGEFGWPAYKNVVCP